MLATANQLPRRFTVTFNMCQDVKHDLGIDNCPTVDSPAAVASVLSEISRLEREIMIAGAVDSQSRLVYWNLVAAGTSDHMLLRVGDAFYGAVRSAASAIFLVHNHPSGSLTPSATDLQLTRDVGEASVLLGYPLLDHIIVSRKGFCSIMTTGTLRRLRKQVFATYHLRGAAEGGPRLGHWTCPRCSARNNGLGSKHGMAPVIVGLCSPARCQRCAAFIWLRQNKDEG